VRQLAILRSVERPPDHRARLGKEDFLRLECVRGLAALYVVLNHARGFMWAGGTYLRDHAAALRPTPAERWLAASNQLTRAGTEAVILFFVLSGFSIAYSLREQSRLREFYLRRLARLYPPYVFGVAWAALVLVVTRGLRSDLYAGIYPMAPFPSMHQFLDFLSPRRLLRTLAYLDSGALIPQYWSLAYEWVFYALAPFLLRSPRRYFLASLGLYAVGLGAGLNGEDRLLQAYAFKFNFYFAVGVILFHEYGRLIPLARVAGARVLGLIALTCFAGIIVLNFQFGRTAATDLLATAMALLSIYAFVELKIDRPALVALGTQSYTLYLTHVASIVLVMTCWYWATGSTPPIAKPYVWWIALPPTLLISWAAARLVEAPSRALVQRLRGAQPGRSSS